ncbi:MAG TPA: helix-turn-helix domain-containing protein [Gemmatimonadales bacterium]|nr:helix-turn-helix domain-containing protein [Gemmatimonadales bacterium]
MDRRAEKTERSLRDALHALIGEKPYERISVREILGRARVGRTTFYAHFRSKDELLRNGLDDVIGFSAPRSILSFSRPIFEHHARHRARAGARLTARAQARLHRRLQGLLEDIIVQRLHLNEGRRSSTMPARLVAQWVAATFIVVLNWWIESGAALSPAEVDGVFRALTVPALQGM